METQKQTVVVTCLVRNITGQIILIRHYKRGWELPQGRVEGGESLTHAVHREVREETGVSIELGPLSVVWTKVCEPPATIFGFTAQYQGGALTPSDETPEVGWFTPEEALSLVTHHVNRQRLGSLLGHSGTVLHHAYQARPFAILEPTDDQRQALATFLAAAMEP